MKNKAQYQNDVDVSEGNFVTLSTCDLDYGFDSDQRLILMGKLNKTEEPINVD